MNTSKLMLEEAEKRSWKTVNTTQKCINFQTFIISENNDLPLSLYFSLSTTFLLFYYLINYIIYTFTIQKKILKINTVN